MQHRAIEPFEKHLFSHFPDNPARIYSVNVPCPYEQEFIVNGIVRLHQMRTPSLHIQRESTQERSLFATAELFILHEPTSLPSEGFVITTGKGTFEEAESLDLTEEKPWERQKRLKRYLSAIARREGCVIEQPALDALLTCADFGVMLRELEKLICYVAQDHVITIHHVHEIGSVPRVSVKGWKAVEAFVRLGADLPLEDPADFFPLLGQVRYVAQKENRPALQHLLFDTEVLARTSYLDETLLWNLFTLRYQHALTPSA